MRSCRAQQEESLEAKLVRERDRSRRDAEVRQQEQDNAYKSLLRKWEAHER